MFALPWVKFAILGVLLFVIGLLYVQLQHEKETRAKDHTEWAEERVSALKASLRQAELFAAQHQADEEKAAKIQAEGEQRNAEIQKRAADLDRTVGGLRGSLAIALRTIGSIPSEAPAITAGCADSRALADLLGRMSIGLSEAGAVISGDADKAWAASVACVSADKLDR